MLGNILQSYDSRRVPVDGGCVSVHIHGVHGSLHSEPFAVLSEQPLLQSPAP